MQLEKNRVLQVLNHNGFTLDEFGKRLGLYGSELANVINGEEPITRRQAEIMIVNFGMIDFCYSLRDLQYISDVIDEEILEGRF